MSDWLRPSHFILKTGRMESRWEKSLRFEHPTIVWLWKRSIQYVGSVAHHRTMVRRLELVVRQSEVLVCGIFNLQTIAGTRYGIYVWKFCSSCFERLDIQGIHKDLHSVLSWISLGWFLLSRAPLSEFPQSACIIARSST